MRVIRSADRQFTPASHEDPANPGVLRRVIATKEELLDGRVQMINWSRLPVGSSFRSHYHEDMEETFIIATGAVEMRVDDETCRLEAGDTIVISPREVHQMTNACQHEVEYIVVGISLGQGGKTVVV